MEMKTRTEGQFTETQRIANLLNISHDSIIYNDNNLCLTVQSKIRNLLEENKKLKFTNTIISSKLNEKNKQSRISEDKATGFQYIDEIKGQFDKLYKTLKKENEELNIANNGLRQENDYYKNMIKDLKRNN